MASRRSTVSSHKASSAKKSNVKHKDKKTLRALAVWRALDTLERPLHHVNGDVDLWGAVTKQLGEKLINDKIGVKPTINERFGTYRRDETLLGSGCPCSSSLLCEEEDAEYLILDELDVSGNAEGETGHVSCGTSGDESEWVEKVVPLPINVPKIKSEIVDPNVNKLKTETRVGKFVKGKNSPIVGNNTKLRTVTKVMKDLSNVIKGKGAPLASKIITRQSTVIPRQTADIIPDQSAVIRSQSTVIPSQTAVITNKSTVIPGQKTVILSQLTVIPNKSAVIPSQSTVIPGQSTVIPGQSTVIPGQSTVIPGQSTVIPGQSTVIPSQSTVIPGQSTVIPSQSTVIPGQSTVIPSQSTVIPSQSTVIPGQSTVIPGQSTVIPSQSTVIPSQSTVIPSQSTVIPGQSTVIPGQSTVIPSQSTVIPSQSTVVVSSQSTVILGQSTIVPGQSTLIQDKSNDVCLAQTTVSTTQPSVNTDQSTVPANQPTFHTSLPTVETTKKTSVDTFRQITIPDKPNDVCPGNQSEKPVEPVLLSTQLGTLNICCDDVMMKTIQSSLDLFKQISVPSCSSAQSCSRPPPDVHFGHFLDIKKEQQAHDDNDNFLRDPMAAESLNAVAMEGCQTIGSMDETTAIPSHQTTIPSHQTTIPSHQTTIPSHQTTIPSHQTTIPSHQTTIPGQETTIPGLETKNTNVTSGQSDITKLQPTIVSTSFSYLKFQIDDTMMQTIQSSLDMIRQLPAPSCSSVPHCSGAPANVSSKHLPRHEPILDIKKEEQQAPYDIYVDDDSNSSIHDNDSWLGDLENMARGERSNLFRSPTMPTIKPTPKLQDPLTSSDVTTSVCLNETPMKLSDENQNIIVVTPSVDIIESPVVDTIRETKIIKRGLDFSTSTPDLDNLKRRRTSCIEMTDIPEMESLNGSIVPEISEVKSSALSALRSAYDTDSSAQSSKNQMDSYDQSSNNQSENTTSASAAGITEADNKCDEVLKSTDFVLVSTAVDLSSDKVVHLHKGVACPSVSNQDLHVEILETDMDTFAPAYHEIHRVTLSPTDHTDTCIPQQIQDEDGEVDVESMDVEDDGGIIGLLHQLLEEEPTCPEGARFGNIEDTSTQYYSSPESDSDDDDSQSAGPDVVADQVVGVSESALSLCAGYGTDEGTRDSMTVLYDDDGVEESMEELSDRRIDLLKQLENMTDSDSCVDEGKALDQHSPVKDDPNECNGLNQAVLLETCPAESTVISSVKEEVIITVSTSPDNDMANTSQETLNVETDDPDQGMTSGAIRPSVMDRLGAKVASSSQNNLPTPEKKRTNLTFWCDDRLEEPMDFGDLYQCEEDSGHKTKFVNDLRCVVRTELVECTEEPLNTERKIIIVNKEKLGDVDWRLAGDANPGPTVSEARAIIRKEHAHHTDRVQEANQQLDGDTSNNHTSQNTTLKSPINATYKSSHSVGRKTKSSGKGADATSTRICKESADKIRQEKSGSSQVVHKKKSMPMEICCSLDSAFSKNTNSMGCKFFEVSMDSNCTISISVKEKNQAKEHLQDLIIKRLSLANAITENKKFLEESCQKTKDKYDRMEITMYGMELHAEYIQMLIFLVKSSGLLLVVGRPYPLKMLARGDYVWLKRLKLHNEVVHTLPLLEDVVFLCTSIISLSEKLPNKERNGFVLRRRIILRAMLTPPKVSLDNIEKSLARLKAYRKLSTQPNNCWSCAGTGHPYFLRAKIQVLHKQIRWMLQLQEDEARERNRPELSWKPPDEFTESSETESRSSKISKTTSHSRHSGRHSPSAGESSPETHRRKRYKSEHVQRSSSVRCSSSESVHSVSGRYWRPSGHRRSPSVKGRKRYSPIRWRSSSQCSSSDTDRDYGYGRKSRSKKIFCPQSGRYRLPISSPDTSSSKVGAGQNKSVGSKESWGKTGRGLQRPELQQSESRGRKRDRSQNRSSSRENHSDSSIRSRSNSRGRPTERSYKPDQLQHHGNQCHNLSSQTVAKKVDDMFSGRTIDRESDYHKTKPGKKFTKDGKSKLTIPLTKKFVKPVILNWQKSKSQDKLVTASDDWLAQYEDERAEQEYGTDTQDTSQESHSSQTEYQNNHSGRTESAVTQNRRTIKSESWDSKTIQVESTHRWKGSPSINTESTETRSTDRSFHCQLCNYSVAVSYTKHCQSDAHNMRFLETKIRLGPTRFKEKYPHAKWGKRKEFTTNSAERNCLKALFMFELRPAMLKEVLALYKMCGVINNYACKICCKEPSFMSEWLQHTVCTDHVVACKNISSTLGRESFWKNYWDVPGEHWILFTDKWAASDPYYERVEQEGMPDDINMMDDAVFRTERKEKSRKPNQKRLSFDDHSNPLNLGSSSRNQQTEDQVKRKQSKLSCHEPIASEQSKSSMPMFYESVLPTSSPEYDAQTLSHISVSDNSHGFVIPNSVGSNDQPLGSHDQPFIPNSVGSHDQPFIPNPTESYQGSSTIMLSHHAKSVVSNVIQQTPEIPYSPVPPYVFPSPQCMFVTPMPVYVTQPYPMSPYLQNVNPVHILSPVLQPQIATPVQTYPYQLLPSMGTTCEVHYHQSVQVTEVSTISASSHILPQ